MNLERPGDFTDRFDAVVVGGGPAGLSAALFLGRSCRRVLVATDGTTWRSVRRRCPLPPVAGLHETSGRGAFHCPYCHGWEVAGEPLALYADGEGGFDLARKLLGWSRDLILFTDGPAGLTAPQRARLAELAVEVREEAIERLVADPAGALQAVVLEGGEAVPRRALFLHPSTAPRSDLPFRLGCAMTPEGRVDADEGGKTSVPGVYIAGDAGANPELVICAAASGTMAAAALNDDLLEQDFGG